MERKIGEIFEYNGKWFQCVESACNKECYFYNKSLHKTIADINGNGFGACNGCFRNDNKSVIFKKLEKVGEPYKFGRKLMQKYNIYAKPYLSDDYGYIYIPGRYNEVISIEIKQNKENMEEQHSTENYPKEDEVATRIANKVGEDIRDQLEKNLNKEDMEEKKQKLDDLVGLYSSAQITYKEFEKELKALYSCKEEIKPNLKEFDLEAAKAGKPVCTRDGRKARIICLTLKEIFQ